MELLRPFLSLVTAFILKSILSGFGTVTPAFLWFHPHEIAFSILLLSVCVSFNLIESLVDSIRKGLVLTDNLFLRKFLVVVICSS